MSVNEWIKENYGITTDYYEKVKKIKKKKEEAKKMTSPPLQKPIPKKKELGLPAENLKMVGSLAI